MGLLDDLSQPPAKLWSCRVRSLASELERIDAKIFLDAVADQNWRAETLAKALNQKGLSISGSVITRHRKGECSCSKI